MVQSNSSPFAHSMAGIGSDSFGFTDSIAIDHQRRLQSYRRFWLYYLGKHWSYMRDPGEPTITINYSRRILDLHNDFTFKKSFKTSIPDDPTTDENEREDREFVRVMLEETWRRNQKPLFAMEMGQMGGVSGDAFLRVSWEPDDGLEDPFARVDIIPSHLCFPTFGGPYGTDRKKLTKLLILTPVYREPKAKQNGGRLIGTPIRRGAEKGQDLIILGEEWTAPMKDKDGVQTRPAMVQYFEGGLPLGAPTVNPLGEIPVVHIPNYPLAGEFYGISDLVDAVELNRELNEKATDISDIINYHGSPVTVITGAKIKDLDKGANRMWGLPEGAKAENLQLDGDLSAATKYWEMIRQAMFELTGTPEQALGKVQAISNTSGAALQIAYMPMMERRDIKVLTYSLGLRKVNRLLMKVTALKDSIFGVKFDALEGNKYRNEVTFPDPMPQDESHELEKSRARIDLGLTTKKKELERQGYSQVEIDELLDGAKAEMEEEAALMFDMPQGAPGQKGPGRGQVQNSRGGNPMTRGAKVSRKAATKPVGE